MKKSKIIAACLVNSEMVNPLDKAEAAVRKSFLENFSQWDFNQWRRQ